MTLRINQLSALQTIQSGDQLAVYSTDNGDTRKVSINDLSEYIQEGFNVAQDSGGDHTHAIADVTGLQDALDNKETSGTAAAVIAAHEAAPDPHSQYLVPADTTDALTEGATNKYFTEARVRSAVLTGISLVTNAAITAADSVLSALGKLQKQITDALASLAAHIADTANPHSVTKSQVGLGNCDNTSDANKPVSTAQQTALDLKAALAGNTFSGAQIYADQVISRGMMKDMGNVWVDKGNSGTSTQTLDYTAGSHQQITATGNHTIATSNWPPTGNTGYLQLDLVNGGAFTVTWPTINWEKPDGTFTTSIATYLAANTGRTALQASGTDTFVFWSRDAGSTIYGRLV